MNIDDIGSGERKIWFTADTHLGHKNILRYEPENRAYDSIEEHDEAVLQAWRETVGETDFVYHLGDLAMGSPRKYKSRLAELPGIKFLVAGNHDTCWHGSKERGRIGDMQRFLDAGFAQVNNGEPGSEWILSYEALGWPGIGQVALCHFPKEPEPIEAKQADRYTAYRPTFKGPVICGHVHSAWKTKGLNINVGFDIWHRPVSAEEIWPLVESMGVEPLWPNKHY